MRSIDVVVIGGGPAGISAAVESAGHGVTVALVDESRSLGGKVLKSNDGGVPIRHTDKIEQTTGKRLLESFQRVADKIELYLDAEVWAIDGNRIEVRITDKPDQRCVQFHAKTMIIATGARERCMPFPGWTLPGVFTVGGLNSFIKKNIIPAHQFVVAGSGPLLLPLACNLIEAGAEVCAVVDATPWRLYAKNAFSLFFNAGFEKLGQGLGYLKKIRRQHVLFYRSHIVTEFVDNNGVKNARLCKVDDEWRPVPGTEINLETDILAVGYGLIPEIELSRQCGCEHYFDPDCGHWRVRLSDNLETTVPGIFVAGDGVEIKGYSAAIDQGRLAALNACSTFKRTRQNNMHFRRHVLQNKLRRAKRFGHAIGRLSEPRAGIMETLDDKTIICRCEEVTLSDIKSAVDDGANDINDIKRRTGSGMGHCQGRGCGQVINEVFWYLAGEKRKRELFTSRIPAKPVPFGVLSSADC